MRNKMTKAVIFDLDGLLVDTEVTWHKVFQDVVGAYGHEMSLQEYVENYSGKTIVDNVKRMIQSYNLPITYDEGVEKMISGEKHYLEQGVALKAGAKELFSFLKKYGYKIALGSSSTKERAVSILSFHQVETYFDEMVSGYEVEHGKPFPDIFLEAAKRVGVLPNECLVLEDSEAGILAAYSGGIPVICVPDLKKPRKEYVDMTAAEVPSLFEVIHYLEREQ